MKPIPGRPKVLQLSMPDGGRPHRSDYVLIVAPDAPFATQLTSELAAVGVATLRASDTHSTRQLLAHRLPRPVVIDLRYAGIPIPAAAAPKP